MISKEKLKKIQALAEQGLDGEKSNAKALLEKLAQESDIDLNALDDEALQDFWFHSRGEENRKILLQVMYKVLGSVDQIYILYRHGKRLKGEVKALCTERQASEINFLFDFYATLWAQEKKIFLDAFIQRNELFGTVKSKSCYEEEDPEKLRKIMALARNIEKGDPVLRLEE